MLCKMQKSSLFLPCCIASCHLLMQFRFSRLAPHLNLLDLYWTLPQQVLSPCTSLILPNRSPHHPISCVLTLLPWRLASCLHFLQIRISCLAAHLSMSSLCVTLPLIMLSLCTSLIVPKKHLQSCPRHLNFCMIKHPPKTLLQTRLYPPRHMSSPFVHTQMFNLLKIHIP
jgi:hypothetical protein